MSHNWRSERVRLALTNSRARREREKAEAAAVIRSASRRSASRFRRPSRDYAQNHLPIISAEEQRQLSSFRSTSAIRRSAGRRPAGSGDSRGEQRQRSIRSISAIRSINRRRGISREELRQRSQLQRSINSASRRSASRFRRRSSHGQGSIRSASLRSAQPRGARPRAVQRQRGDQTREFRDPGEMQQHWWDALESHLSDAGLGADLEIVTRLRGSARSSRNASRLGYTVVAAKGGDEEECSICLGATSELAQLDACGHRLCVACLKRWASKTRAGRTTPCPFCRKPIERDGAAMSAAGTAAATRRATLRALERAVRSDLAHGPPPYWYAFFDPTVHSV